MLKIWPRSIAKVAKVTISVRFGLRHEGMIGEEPAMKQSLGISIEKAGQKKPGIFSGKARASVADDQDLKAAVDRHGL